MFEQRHDEKNQPKRKRTGLQGSTTSSLLVASLKFAAKVSGERAVLNRGEMVFDLVNYQEQVIKTEKAYFFLVCFFTSGK